MAGAVGANASVVVVVWQCGDIYDVSVVGGHNRMMVAVMKTVAVKISRWGPLMVVKL
jgi:hypothetical protein